MTRWFGPTRTEPINPADRPRTQHRISAVGRMLLVLSLGQGCGLSADPAIADQLHTRLTPSDPHDLPVPCPDRLAKIDALRSLTPLAVDLRARIHAFDDPLPPQLHQRLMQIPLVGRAAPYHCVMHDFARIDRKTEPDMIALRGLVANLYVAKAKTLFARRSPQAGWNLIIEALALYGTPATPTLSTHSEVRAVLESIDRLLRVHPPPPSIATSLIEAIVATEISIPLVCRAARHQLRTLATATFEPHLKLSDPQSIDSPAGATLDVPSERPSSKTMLGRAEWNYLREIYDAVTEHCPLRPLRQSIQQATAPLRQLNELHPRTGRAVHHITERLKGLAQVRDHQVSVLAALYRLHFHTRWGRSPDEAELVSSFGSPPHSPWDGSIYHLSLDDIPPANEHRLTHRSAPWAAAAPSP